MRRFIRIGLSALAAISGFWIPSSPAHAQSPTTPDIVVSAGHAGVIDQVVVAPNGRWLASAGADRTIKIWDWSTGRLLRTLTGHESAVKSIAVLPDGKRLISAGLQPTDPIRIWDVETGRTITSWQGAASTQPTRLLAISGRVLLAASDTTVSTWDFENGTLRSQAKTSASNMSFALSPDRRVLAIGHVEGPQTGSGISLLNTTTGAVERQLLPRHRSLVSAVAFSPDGERLASASWDKTIRIWSTRTGDVLHTLQAQGYRGAASLAFSLDGSALI